MSALLDIRILMFCKTTPWKNLKFIISQAAIRAGYSKKTAKEQNAQNLVKLSIQSALTGRIKDREKRTEISSTRLR